MKYLITGGCGFLGSNIAARLLAEGTKPLLFDNLLRDGSELNLEWLCSLGSLEFQKGDIRDYAVVENLIKRYQPEVVFHLAGQVAMTTSLRYPRQDFDINVGGTINLLEAAAKHSPETILLYSSSNKVYGPLAQVQLVEEPFRYKAVNFPNGIDELQQLDFRTPYGCSKGAADQYMLEYARTYALKTVVFRHSTIYGGRQYSTYDQGWVGWFCRQALQIKKNRNQSSFTISGNGKQVRDLLYVDDAVDCYLSAIRNIEQVQGKAFNIGGGIENSSSLLELFGFLEELLQIKLSYNELPWRHEDQRFFVANNSKARNSFGWSPNTNKSDGVTRMLTWVEAAIAGEK